MTKFAFFVEGLRFLGLASMAALGLTIVGDVPTILLVYVQVAAAISIVSFLTLSPLDKRSGEPEIAEAGFERISAHAATLGLMVITAHLPFFRVLIPQPPDWLTAAASILIGSYILVEINRGFKREKHRRARIGRPLD